VAAVKANVLKVNHTRNVRGIPLGSAYIDLELETRGIAHIREIIGYLKANQYQIDHVEKET